MKNKNISILLMAVVLAAAISAQAEEMKENDTSSQTKRRAARTQFRSWKREPFVPQGLPGSPSKLVLSGIIAHGNEFKAMIGDAIVGKGDRIGDNTVVEVRKDSVVLNDGVKDFEIKMEQ